MAVLNAEDFESLYQNKTCKVLIHESILHIVLDNGKHNVISDPEFVPIEVLKDLIERHPLKGLVISSKGRCFSTGADLSLLLNPETANFVVEKLQRARALLDFIENLPLVTVSLVDGMCLGAGFEIALATQFILATPKARFGLPETMQGLLPGLNGCKRLQARIGRSKTIYMTLSTQLYTAVESLVEGLIYKIYDNQDLYTEALRLIDDMTKDKTQMLIGDVISLTNYYTFGKGNTASEGKAVHAYESWLFERSLHKLLR